MKQQTTFHLKAYMLTAVGFFLTLLLHAQDFELKGRVIDAVSRNPIAGASITVKNMPAGTTTNDAGEFSIMAQKGGVLVVTFVGYEDGSAKITGNNFIEIPVYASETKLNDVVVTALGIKKESKRLGYAIQEVKGADLLKAREPNPVENLAGKVAGLNVGVTQELLTAPVVLLRGGTVTFYVVDGLPINSDTWNISPDDIETFTVLKGPAAAALYGNRGINGAILITTKHGMKNKKGWTVEFNSSNQLNKGFIALPKVQNQYGPGDYQKYAFGDGLGGGVNDADYDVWGPIMDGRLLPQYDGKVDPTQTYKTTFADGSTYSGHIQPTPFVARGVNNMQNFLQAGLLTTNNINMSSVTDHSNVRFSASQSYQKGIVPNTGVNKLNFNLYGSYDINSKFKIEGNINYNRQFSNNIPDVTYGPNSIVYDIDVWMGADWNINSPDIKNYWPAGGGPAGDRPTFSEYKHYQNPWFLSQQWTRGVYKNDLYGYLNLDYKFSKHVEGQLRSNITTYDMLRTEDLPWWAHPYSQEYHNHGNYREDRRDLWENNTEAIIKYNGDLGNSGINISALCGATARNFKYTSSYVTTNQLITPDLYNFDNSLYALQGWNFTSNMLVLSTYGSIDLTYKKYLTISATGRLDKSSALPTGHNAYFYPSASISTVVSDYLNLPRAVSFLKFRANYANVKDGGTSAYIGATPTYNNGGFPLDYGGQYYSVYGGPSYGLTTPYQTSLGYNNQTVANSPSTIVNPNIVPQTRTNYEGGFDIKFLSNRLGLSATYFEYLNGPLQTTTPISQTSGYSGFLTNALKEQTTGGEISIQGTPVQLSNSFRWDVLVNWSTYKQIYKDLPVGTIDGNGYALHAGDRVDLLTGNVEAKTPDGQLINDKSGLPIYLPVAHVLGHGDPDWSWGVNNKFSYKNFTLSFQFDGMVGGKIQDNVLRKQTEGGRGLNTATGLIGEARYYEAYHYGDPGYNGAYVNGKAILAQGVQIASGTPVYDAQGNITNFKDLSFVANNTATHWVQDYVSSFYNDPQHTMTSKTYAKLREVVITYSLPEKLLRKTFITRVDLSLVGRNLLYFFNPDFKDMDVDQYPGRDMFGNAHREYTLQTPTTRSYGFNVNVQF